MAVDHIVREEAATFQGFCGSVSKNQARWYFLSVAFLPAITTPSPRRGLSRQAVLGFTSSLNLYKFSGEMHTLPTAQRINGELSFTNCLHDLE